MKSILITKNTSESKLLVDFCLINNLELQTKSLISLSRVECVSRVETDVVFFGSKNAFDFYLLHQNHDNKVEISCIGEATKSHIEKLGFFVSFCGKNSGDSGEVSRDLNEYLSGKSICFIKSNLSKDFIMKHIASKIIQEMVLYQTTFEPIKFESQFDIIIFTSPSNANSFLKKNHILKSMIIAWGKSTESELLKHNIQTNYVLQTSGFKELIEVLSPLI